jgi:hypothetical protein
MLIDAITWKYHEVVVRHARRVGGDRETEELATAKQVVVGNSMVMAKVKRREKSCVVALFLFIVAIDACGLSRDEFRLAAINRGR